MSGRVDGVTAVGRPWPTGAFDVELLKRCRSRAADGDGYAGVYEQPLECWIARSDSKVRPWSVVWAGVELVRLWLGAGRSSR